MVVTKSGKQTHGLGRFFSSLYDHPVLGLAFFELSLVSVDKRHAFPMHTEQVIRPAAKAKPARSSKGKAGHPRGSKTQDKNQVSLNRELLHIKGMITALLVLIGGLFSFNYLLLDGYKYVEEVLKLLPQKPDPVLLASILAKVANLGAIHPIIASENTP